jgi:hypothetical protein
LIPPHLHGEEVSGSSPEEGANEGPGAAPVGPASPASGVHVEARHQASKLIEVSLCLCVEMLLPGIAERGAPQVLLDSIAPLLPCRGRHTPVDSKEDLLVAEVEVTIKAASMFGELFYSMASSSGEDVPRGLDFLMSRNRLNVAVSRAQCLAYVTCSPRLLEVDCRTVEHLKLANALCRFVEIADLQASPR